MVLNMSLWQVEGNQLTRVVKSKLDSEQRLEEWVARDPSILGLDVLLIGRQVITAYGGRIDLLALDRQGDLVIIELKRDRTPREIVAQVLDYASWVRLLTYQEIDLIASNYLGSDLPAAFHDYFGEALPERINTDHSMVIVASELDESSERIVRYLAEEHDVNINAIFFSTFALGHQEILGRAWLMDPEKVQERSESRKQAPWTGMWFVNVGEGEHRNWDDNRKYGYIGAGQGVKYSAALQRLKLGSKIFAYIKGHGYVGYGEVIQEATMIKDFKVDGQLLLDYPLQAPHANENIDDPELAEWVVGVNWIKTIPREEAKTFKGVFANQNITCKLRHPDTLEFLTKEFNLVGIESV